MKVVLWSANLGSFDKPIDPVKQDLPAGAELTWQLFTDENFPPRFNAMTPRLQARIVKMFGWQLIPHHEYYIWVDSSCTLSRPDSVKWFIDQCQGVDMVVFKHPNRGTIQEEADYLKERLSLERAGKKQKYILPRYENEDIDGQLAEIKADTDFKDKNLYASTAYIYRYSDKVRDMMKEWWYHTSRYHSIDQLSLPYVLDRFDIKLKVIPDSYMKIPYLKYVRK